MRSPLVMPSAGQKSLRRLVSFTRRSPSATSTSSWSRGIIPPVGQRAGVGGGRRGPRRVAGWWSVVARGIALGGDVVLAEWRLAVERRDGGRRIEWWGMSVAEVQGGRIRRWREYWNPADVA